MVITPRHDYYPLTLEAQEQVPRFLRSWITPREPPQDHVVSIKYHAFCSMLVSTYCGDFICNYHEWTRLFSGLDYWSSTPDRLCLTP